MFLCVLFIIIPAFIDYALLRDLPNVWVMFATLGFWLVVVIAFSISKICKKEQLEKQDAKIQAIMMKPARSWNTMQRTIFVALTSAIITAVVTLLVQYLF